MRKKWDIVTSKHHRLMRGNGGGNEPKNISIVPHYKHVAFHVLFGNMTTEKIVEQLNNIWLDPDIQIIIKKR